MDILDTTLQRSDLLNEQVGPLSIPVLEVWTEFSRDWAERSAEIDGTREPYLFTHYNMSEVGHNCIRRLSYPILKMQAPRKTLSEKELEWKKLGVMTAAIGKVVHRYVQACLQAIGLLTKETTEQRIENLIPTHNLVGKYDGLTKLGLIVSPNVEEVPQPEEAILLEIKTWNYSKLVAKRGSRFGGDDYEKLVEYYSQVQPMLHALGLKRGVILTIDVGYVASHLLEKSKEWDKLLSNVEPAHFDIPIEDFASWLVEYDPSYTEETVLSRAAHGLEATNKQELPDGEPWLGDGFCPWAYECEFATRQCGKR